MLTRSVFPFASPFNGDNQNTCPGSCCSSSLTSRISIRQHTSAYVSIRQHSLSAKIKNTCPGSCCSSSLTSRSSTSQHTSTSADVSIRCQRKSRTLVLAHAAVQLVLRSRLAFFANLFLCAWHMLHLITLRAKSPARKTKFHTFYLLKNSRKKDR